MWAYKLLKTKYFHGVSSGNQPPYVLKSRYGKVSFVRRTFDFYEEQITYLKQASLREQLEGKEGSMNAMVREAVDDWIAKRTSTK